MMTKKKATKKAQPEEIDPPWDHAKDEELVVDIDKPSEAATILTNRIERLIDLKIMQLREELRDALSPLGITLKTEE